MFKDDYTDDEIIEMLKIGNKQGWIKHYQDVLAEISFLNVEVPEEHKTEKEE